MTLVFSSCFVREFMCWLSIRFLYGLRLLQRVYYFCAYYPTIKGTNFTANGYFSITYTVIMVNSAIILELCPSQFHSDRLVPHQCQCSSLSLDMNAVQSNYHPSRTRCCLLICTDYGSFRECCNVPCIVSTQAVYPVLMAI